MMVSVCLFYYLDIKGLPENLLLSAVDEDLKL